MGSREISERMKSDGAEAMSMAPEEFGEFLKRDLSLVSKLVKDLEIPKQ